MKQENHKNEHLFQKEFEMFKNHLENAKLHDIFEIYLPYWHCKQSIVIDKSVELDRFSIIILQTIESGLIKQTEICKFLGIETDSFVMMQFHYLIKNELIIVDETLSEVTYNITRDGFLYLKRKKKITMTEMVNFTYCYNDLTQKFFKENCSLNNEKDELKDLKNSTHTSKFKIKETHKTEHDIFKIPHAKKPYNIKNVELAEYFNQQNTDKVFYDVVNKEKEMHKRSICYLAFEYIDENNELIYEIRHFKKTVNNFEKYELEEELSKKVTAYFRKKPRLMLS
ncbi:MAG TPA: hypothetical protein PK323_10330 [Bacteroidia bacterium]|nr:hypothetical protein [Bacteroidia bacterium]